jgi:hypothetical protein
MEFEKFGPNFGFIELTGRPVVRETRSLKASTQIKLTLMTIFPVTLRFTEIGAMRRFNTGDEPRFPPELLGR